MGPLERFIGAVTAAIGAATGPGDTTPAGDAAATPPAIVRPAMPDSIPLPRPRPDPEAPVEAPAPAVAATGAVMANPFVPPGDDAAGPVEPPPAAEAPPAETAISPPPEPAAVAETAPPAPIEPPAAPPPPDPAVAANPFVAPPGTNEPPPALEPVAVAAVADAQANVVVPGVTILVVRANAGPAVAADPVPLNLPDLLATLGQTNVATAQPGEAEPLGFAPLGVPLDGPTAAIDALLRGGIDAAPAGALVADTAPLPRANPLPEGERVRVAALPGVAAFVPAPAGARQHDNACLTQLAGLALVATILPPVEDGTCGIATPVDVAQLGIGRSAVTLSPDATVDCSVVGALDAWMNEDVQEAANRLFGQRVTSLRIGSAYACRGINNDPTAQLSEHAFGRAIDISAFQFADGTWLEVHAAAANTPEGAFLGEIRTDACGPFRTVLGPGVAYHGDHFHLDLAERGRNGDALYCR